MTIKKLINLNKNRRDETLKRKLNPIEDNFFKHFA